MNLDAPLRNELLTLARHSIESALPDGVLASFPAQDVSEELTEPGSTFVTLQHRVDGLRGCCGTIEAVRPLAEDVWRSAWAAAFRDPRFPPLRASEWPQVELHISVLTPPEPLLVSNEQELVSVLRPGVDGLILERGAARATFLPSVWDQLAERREFLRQLKRKAGWRDDFWAPDIRVFRYRTESFGEHDASR